MNYEPTTRWPGWYRMSALLGVCAVLVMLAPGDSRVAAEPLQPPPEVGVTAESRPMPRSTGLDVQFQIGTIRFGLPWLRSIPIAPGRQWILRLIAADDSVTIGAEPPELRLAPNRPTSAPHSDANCK